MDKTKVVIVSDDIRFPSGVSNISKQIILGTLDRYDWIQISAQHQHTDNNNVIDISKSVSKITGVKDAYARLYCTTGYGDYATFNKVMNNENPDILLHMSDPHYFSWIYEYEYEIRKRIPIGYYHVWDNDPIPTFNKSIYQSCDSIASISKLTHKLVNQVTNNSVPNEYIPHGVDTNVFKKLDITQTKKCKANILENGCKFVMFCNNRNLKRKQLLNLLESYQEFCDTIGTDNAKNTLLLIHTNPIGRSTSNLYTASDYINKTGNVKFSESVVDESTLCQMYNVADVTLNVSSNEGFGLSTLESLSCETPIIATRTGGLSEQLDDKNTWGIGLNPTSRILNGSPKVPFLYEDFVDKSTIASAMISMYETKSDVRNEMGKLGREYIINNNYTSQDMISNFSTYINNTLENYTPRESYSITKI